MHKQCLGYWTKRVGMSLLCSMIVCSMSQVANACSMDDDWHVMHGDGALVGLKLPSDPMPIGEPLAVEIKVCESDPLHAEQVRISAVMPAHKHGMNYRPVVREIDSNVFRGENFLLHMPGAWRILVELLHGSSARHFELDLTAR